MSKVLSVFQDVKINNLQRSVKFIHNYNLCNTFDVYWSQNTFKHFKHCRTSRQNIKPSGFYFQEIYLKHIRFIFRDPENKAFERATAFIVLL